MSSPCYGAFVSTIFCLWLILSHRIAVVRPEIHSRTSAIAAGSSNAISAADADNEGHEGSNEFQPLSKFHSALDRSAIKHDFSEKLSWQCANNASCLHSLATDILQAYKRGETVSLGFMDLAKMPATTQAVKDDATTTGRGISSFVDFISGNAIRIPVGPMVFSVQRADDDANYIEVALLKKRSGSQGRDGIGGGDGLLGGLGGGGGDGDGGGGGGGHRGRHRHRQKQDTKQFQMYIPIYLAATTFGWTMVAAKAVGLLTLKALAVSKLAFIVAAMVIIKKLMDNASEKMMYQFPEHSPYMNMNMMPYSMDYGMHPELAAAGGDMYPAAALHLATSPLQQHQAGGLESLAAESSMHHSIADMQNNTQVLAALNAVHLGPKVKREDSWLAKSAAAAAAVGVRRPLVYNYLQPHNPYYRV